MCVVGGFEVLSAVSFVVHPPTIIQCLLSPVGLTIHRDVDGAAHVVGYRTTCGRIARVVVGAVDGFGSSLTGTSGPVILLPILIALKWEILDALGSAQAVQTPIALAATVAYVTLRPGVIDFVLGGCLMAGLVPGAFVGAKIAHSIPVHRLKLGVSAILVVASLFLIGKLVWIEVKDGLKMSVMIA